jgi:drug/metabolite transporter (DMT)-like permease
VNRRTAALFLLVGALWGVPYLLIRVAVSEVAPPIVVFARVSIGSLILFPLAWRNKIFQELAGKWKYVLGYAIGEMIIPWMLISKAEEKLPSGLSGLLVATVPIFSTIFASIDGDKTVWHRKRLFGMVLGFIGMALVIGIESFQGSISIMAIFEIIIGAIGYSWATALVTKHMPKVDGISINAAALIISAIFYLPLAIINFPSHALRPTVTLSLIALGIFPTAAAFVIYFILMREVGPARGSLVTYLNTAFAVILGIIFLGEKLTLGIVIGLPMVLIGSYYAGRKENIEQSQADIIPVEDR